MTIYACSLKDLILSCCFIGFPVLFLVSWFSLSGLGRLGLLSVFVFMRWESIHDLCLNGLGWTFWIGFWVAANRDPMGQGDTLGKASNYGTLIFLQYVHTPAVFFCFLCWENTWGSLPKSFRSNYKNTRSGRRKLYALLLCRKSRSLPLDVPSDSLCSTGNHVPSHCQLQNMAPQYASSLQMNSLQYWHLPPALPSPANATQPMKPCPITVACNSWKVRTHLGQYRIWLVHCSFN